MKLVRFTNLEGRAVYVVTSWVEMVSEPYPGQFGDGFAHGLEVAAEMNDGTDGSDASGEVVSKLRGDDDDA
jgi:hypothetical protein